MQAVTGRRRLVSCSAQGCGGSLVAFLAICLLLCATHAEVFAQSDSLRLIDAVRQQQSEVVRSLLPVSDVNAIQPDGATAVHWAAYQDDPEMVRLLVGAGADPDVANELGVTPLVLACANGNPIIVKLLLDAGAEGIIVPFVKITTLFTLLFPIIFSIILEIFLYISGSPPSILASSKLSTTFIKLLKDESKL